MTSDRFREWDAAYLLGALSPEDRHAFERHLPTCPACAGAVAELAGLPGILAALPAAEAVALTEDASADASATVPATDAAHLRGAQHQPGSVQRLAGAAVARTRRNRLRLAVAGTAVAAGLALGGGFLGAILGTPATLEAAPPASASADPAPTMVVAMEPVEADALTAALTITDTDWGTRFDWSCVYLNQLWKDNGPQDYDMVMTDQDGTATVLATWTATSPSTENLAASTDVPLDQIRSVEIRAGLSGLPLAHTDL
ncbi:hypothetical protein C3B59_01510 [Cryobacterium zongtaii]|uniref:Putative zinc-finger domain-containing protein n=1 Tax=Cryobacterium zongtaii TaxID=1259217 RepID=A0A2S3ZQK8_9MICO|nr:zf-HC2 domain-containing protein [Cryobacterium zongtaii]POH71302.1 hypothetical protein C3B59_01510 [Cryobacterium zongtaii]